MEVDVLPDRVYDLIVSVHMMENSGEFSMRFQEQPRSKKLPE